MGHILLLAKARGKIKKRLLKEYAKSKAKKGGEFQGGEIGGRKPSLSRFTWEDLKRRWVHDIGTR